MSSIILLIRGFSTKDQLDEVDKAVTGAILNDSVINGLLGPAGITIVIDEQRAIMEMRGFLTPFTAQAVLENLSCILGHDSKIVACGLKVLTLSINVDRRPSNGLIRIGREIMIKLQREGVEADG